MASNFAAKWKLVSSENLEEFLKKIGMNIVKRKIAVKVKPENEIKLTDKGFTFIVRSTVKNSEDTYEWGKVQDDADPVGEKGTQVWKMEGDEMVGEFTYEKSGLKIVIVRKIVEGKMVQTMTLDGLECVRVFEKC